MSIKLFPIVNNDAIITEFKKHQEAGTEMYRTIRCAAFTVINGQKCPTDFDATDESTYKLELVMPYMIPLVLGTASIVILILDFMGINDINTKARLINKMHNRRKP